MKVNIEGRWTSGKITTEMEREFHVEIPGNQTRLGET